MGEEGSSVDLAPPQASPLDVLFVDHASRQIMSAVKGTVRFEVTGYNGRTWWMHVTFGIQPEADPPNATIAVDADTYAFIDTGWDCKHIRDSCVLFESQS